MPEPVGIAVETPAADVSVEQQADGSVIVNLETKRREKQAKDAADKFDANLAEDLGRDDLSEIATELIEGINADVQSRQQWTENYNRGLELLGIKIEDVNKTETQSSTVRHPLLLHAIVKGQSLAQAEMLPASGPCKVRNDSDLDPGVAEDLQRSMNWYLTVRATEYYPDTDRMLFYLYYGGTTFKKIYRCPLRRRPVSEAIYMPDLIISQGATDLSNALRVTHKIEMSQNDVLRYMRAKHWRDVDLPEPTERVEDTDAAEANVTGISAGRTRREDWPRTIYECYCWLDLSRWALKERGQEAGVELPYRVTLDADSQEVLEIRRNWKQNDPLKLPRRRFVKYGLVPGLGFLSLGYLHLLGNHARALTALERILIDAGIFASFPGGVKSRGIRGESNVIRPAPGEFVEIDAPVDGDVSKAIMPLPFAGPSAEVLALLQHIEAVSEKAAGAFEVVSGEGSTNVPVGTIMAQIEQATQVSMAVHRRQHQAQAEELSLLRELLVEEPELLHIPDTQPKWTKEQLASAGLVPASDPNIPAHIHRIMQAWALEMLATAHPQLYNQYEVQKRLLAVVRINDPESLLIDPTTVQSNVPQDPTAMIALLTAKIEAMKAQVKAKADEAKNATEQMKLAQKDKKEKDDQQLSAADMALRDKHHAEDLAEKAADRQSREETSQWAMHNERDIFAQELAAQRDIESLSAVTENRNLDIQEKGLAAKEKSDMAGLAIDAADRDRNAQTAERARQDENQFRQREATTTEQGRREDMAISDRQHRDDVDLQHRGLDIQERTAERSAERGQDKSAAKFKSKKRRRR